MNSEERVMKSLNFQTPDRIPIGRQSFWSEFVEKWRQRKKLSKEVNINDWYESDISVIVADETFFPSQKRISKKENGYVFENDGWGRIIKWKEGANRFQFPARDVENILEDKSKLDKIKFEPASLDIRYKYFSSKVKEEKKKRCVFCKVGGPFHRSWFIRGNNLLMDLAGDVGFAKRLAEKVGEHRIGIGLESLKRGNLYDAGIWIFDDMGANTGPLFSPKTFEKVYFPVYKKMISSFKKAGAKKVILHSDGNILPFLDMLIEAGINGINPVEYKAGMNILKLKKKYDKKLSYIGGVDNAIILPRGDKKEIKNHVCPILEAGREGGIIIGTHSIGPDITIETYDYYHNLIRRYGNYEIKTDGEFIREGE